MPKKRSSRAATPKNAPKPKKRRRPAKNEPVTPPEQLPPERPIEDGDGLNFVTLVEAASRKNTHARRKDPTLDVADLPVVYVMATGSPRTPGAPFRLSVPDLGYVIVDPQLATLAPEGAQPTQALEVAPSLRRRAEKHATRLVGPLPWRWASPRRERPITPREEQFIEWLAEQAVRQLMQEQRAGPPRTRGR